MKNRRALLVLAMVFALTLGFAAQAFGAVAIVIDQPDAAYQARTTKIDYSALEEGAIVTSVADSNLTVTFDQSMEKRDIDGAGGADEFNWWGTLPWVESETADVLFTEFGSGMETPPQTVAMSLSKPVKSFGFEMAPRWGGAGIAQMPSTVTFKLSQDGSEFASVTKTLEVLYEEPYSYEAQLFSISSDTAFDKVEISATYPTSPDYYGLGVAQLRYSESAAPIVSGTVKSAATGVPIPFAHIFIENNGNYVAEADADYKGQYAIPLPPSSYTFTAWSSGWGSVEEVVVVPDASITQDFALTAQYSQVIYRFFNMKAGTHFYTASDAEFINVYGTQGKYFKYDGIAYSVQTQSQDPTKPLYRFFNRKSGVHLYTADEAEKANVLAKLSGLYTYEGIAYNVAADNQGAPVYRFYVPKRNAHFYTLNTSEISAKLSNYYHFEGVSFYVGRAK